MKSNKVLSYLLISAFFLTTLITPTYAETKTTTPAQVAYHQNGSPVYFIEDLATLPIEQTMSYTEMKSYMKKNDFSDQEITEFENEHLRGQNSSRSGRASASETRYQTFTFRAKTKSSGIYAYKTQPQLTVGLRYSKDSRGQWTPDRILELKWPEILTSGGKKCFFKGNFYYTLQSGNSIYWRYVGELYGSGNYTFSGGASVGLNTLGTLTMGVNKTGDYLGQTNDCDTYVARGFSK